MGKHTDAIRMTCVFAYNVRDFQKNPFFVDTPFGRPVIVSVGDVCSERDDLETEREELLVALEKIEQQLDYGQIKSAYDITRAILAKVKP